MHKVYGPYTRPDGRKHVIHWDGIKKRTQSYPRYLMEQHLGRTLEEWEHVDHINNDPTDDRIENFQLLTQVQNNKKSAKGTKMLQFVCPTCLGTFEKEYSEYKNNQLKQGKEGPFCSKRCNGLVNH